MDAFIIGLYGLYLILVGVNGNSGALVSTAKKDLPGFLPWLIALAVLAALYENDTTRPVAKPFLFLAILAFVLKNQDSLKQQMGYIYDKAMMAANSTTQTGVAQ